MSTPTPSTDAAPIPLVDLKAAHAQVADEVQAGFAQVLTNTAFIMGPDVKAFEEAFATFCGVKHCIGVSSGTDALELAIRAAELGPGDEIILPANTFIATALSVVRAGATPVFVDCDARHMLIDPAAIEARLTEHTRAIVPVHLYGQLAPMREVNDLAAKHELLVMEDMAQAQGASQQSTDGKKRAGALSLIAGTSFYPGKNLGAYGDAGAVVTDDDALAQRVQELRNYGSTKKYEHPVAGFNCRLDTLQAVVLNAKLKRLDAWNAQRREAAARYDAMLAEVDEVTPVPVLPGNEHIYHLYVIRVPHRDAVLAKLHEGKVGAGIHYPTPLHLTGAFEHLRHKRGDFPVSEKAADEILSLPMFPELTEAQQRRVLDVLKQAIIETA